MPPIGRLGIDDIRPSISEGRLPAKAVVGEVVPVYALLWREGHDAIAGTLEVTAPGDDRPTAIAMSAEAFNPDAHHAIFVPDRPGRWTFRVMAWSDPIATWRNAVTKKLAAGQSAEELANDYAHGAQLLRRAAANVPASESHERQHLLDAAAELDQAAPALALSSLTTAILAEHPLRDLPEYSHPYEVLVERRKALFSAWYELFPRSTGGVSDGRPVHGTLASAEEELERVARMGFDTVYFPPIHPIGTINRKGKNNTLTPEPEDVGSPWAIGSVDGGHDAIHPELGTFEDFDHLVHRAEQLGIEVALDLALQVAPDHPWAAAHPEFFTVLADGTIAYAENPPKKYQDIYPLNFDNDPQALYEEIYRVVMVWVRHGVTTFRVDNPHTKPANFWHWLINKVHETHPEVIFLAEAFTRSARMFGLAKAGFSQSYTYFTWKVTKAELVEFIELLLSTADIARPNLFVNTPDILHASLQYGGRAMFAIRAALAATISPLWGVYSGFELFEHEAVAPGSEEYRDSEKYQLRPRDFEGAAQRGDSLAGYLTLLNRVRRVHPALQQLRTLTIQPTDNDNLLAYSKVDPISGDAVLVVVNLDPRHTQEGTVFINYAALGLDEGATFKVYDEVTHTGYQWGPHNFVRLNPANDVAHIFHLPDIAGVAVQRRAQLAWRQVTDYRP